MKYYRYIYVHIYSIFLGILLLSLPKGELYAQNSIEDLTTDDVVFYKEKSIGLKLHTNGFGFNYNRAKIHNIYKKSFYEIEFLNIKHPKERRQQSLYNSGRNSARGYIFGKQNSFYNLNFSWGKMRSIARKGSKRNGVVDISWYYSGGPSLGIAKPYYLEIVKGFSQGYLITSDEKYSSENASQFLDNTRIYGASGILFGWKDAKFYPGIQAKIGTNFDWASYNEFVKAIEVGVMANAYLKRVPIMVVDDNHLFFANIYIQLRLGRRK